MTLNYSDYERLYFGNRQVNVAHFYGVKWDGSENPTLFAFGYFTPDEVYHQGIVRYDPETGFDRPVFNTF